MQRYGDFGLIPRKISQILVEVVATGYRICDKVGVEGWSVS